MNGMNFFVNEMNFFEITDLEIDSYKKTDCIDKQVPTLETHATTQISL